MFNDIQLKKLGGGGAGGMDVVGASDTCTSRDTREAYITYIYIQYIFITISIIITCVHENRDHDDDHFENEAVRLSLNADRFAIDWSNPIQAYIYIYIYWYLCLPVSAEAVFQIIHKSAVRVCLYLCRLPVLGTCVLLYTYINRYTTHVYIDRYPTLRIYIPTSMTPNRITDWTAMGGILSFPLPYHI